MKFTLGWLKSHLDTAASLKEITDRLTMIGLELEGVTDPGAKLAPFKLGRKVPYLVTGASGSLGKAIVKRLRAEGHRVRVFQRRIPAKPEDGLPGYDSVLHYGIVAPAGTPRAIVNKLNAALREALKASDTKERMATDGTEPLPSTPEEYAADIDREETKWSAVVRKAGAKAE